jgi:glycosyltransferase involved in cell wall biosynthesis
VVKQISAMVGDGPSPSVFAYPLHGQGKLLSEGYRTRDGHFIEWFGRLLDGRGPVGVVSRPEPLYRRLTMRSNRPPAANTVDLSTFVMRVPKLTNRRDWWDRSAALYPTLPADAGSTPAVVWNPFVALAPPEQNPFHRCSTVVLDLLDDWTLHYAFASIRPRVEAAYEAAFARATHVVTNAEGTLELARRYGRDDAVLLLNGCDPERFPTDSVATGPLTVGYVGKIGKRLDLQLITTVASRLPEVDFRFAGPILDREYRAPLSQLANVTLLGDVHYADVPDLLRTFDVGWVPHRVGEGEVGGDVIKTYEYRAAGLPVLTTPVAGASSRGLDEVYVRTTADEHRDWIAAAGADGPRVPRRLSSIAENVTWRHKTETLLPMLGLDRVS